MMAEANVSVQEAATWANRVLDRVGLDGLAATGKRLEAELESVYKESQSASRNVLVLSALSHAIESHPSPSSEIDFGLFLVVGDEHVDPSWSPPGYKHLWTNESADSLPRVHLWCDWNRRVSEEAAGEGVRTFEDSVRAWVRGKSAEWRGLDASSLPDLISRLVDAERERRGDAETRIRRARARIAAANLLLLNPTAGDAEASAKGDDGSSRADTFAVAIVEAAENGSLPSFYGQTTELYIWCGKLIGRDKTTAYRALREAGTGEAGQRGKTGATLRTHVEGLLDRAAAMSPEMHDRVQNVRNEVLNQLGDEG